MTNTYLDLDEFRVLAERFRAAQLETCAVVSAETPYRPNWFESQVRAADGPGAVEYTERLVVNPEAQTGFWRLVELRRERQTIEHMVLDPTWAPLFLDRHRRDRSGALAAAAWRLDQARKPGL